MTREEAILHMTLRREELKCSVSDLDEDIKAFDMAIKALEQEPCEDAISKADVEEIKEIMTDINGDSVYVVRMKDIRALPPVQPQPCEDCISREKLIKDLNFLYNEDGFIKDTGAKRIIEVIMGQAPSTPQPKTGHWIYEDVLYSRCSECGELAIIANWSKVLSDYCPNCGTKMVEPQESEEEA